MPQLHALCFEDWPPITEHETFFTGSYTDCSTDNYHNTVVFVSKDPENFGTYWGGSDGDTFCTKLHAHAPEVLLSGDGMFITTCGWRGWGTPIEGAVAIAKLTWEE